MKPRKRTHRLRYGRLRSGALWTVGFFLLAFPITAAEQGLSAITEGASGGRVPPGAEPGSARVSAENVALASNGARMIADSVYPPTPRNW